jgi:RNA polymerase sigma-70 factor (ECF subfamily)
MSRQPLDETRPFDPDGRTSLTLLQGLWSNDQAAWRRLVNLYEPLVTKWCQRGGLTFEDARDLTQEVFRRVAEHIATFRRDQPGQSFRKWLKTITLNLVRNHLRDRAGQPRATGGEEQQLAAAQWEDRLAEDDSTDQLRQERLEVLYRALQAVQGDFSTTTWIAFRRTAIDGEAAVDVARELNLTAKAVRQARCRVLSRLRAEFAGFVEWEDGEVPS